jgi:hypothetical protein
MTPQAWEKRNPEALNICEKVLKSRLSEKPAFTSVPEKWLKR